MEMRRQSDTLLLLVVYEIWSWEMNIFQQQIFSQSNKKLRYFFQESDCSLYEM